MTEIVHASPTKDFFISMITKDIKLEDCILDLLDNCVDGARSTLVAERKAGTVARNPRFSGFYANLEVKAAEFTAKDNCGGISIEQAKEYAFHFGRRRDAPRGAPETVGLYGIGMKRAMFKIGKMIMVRSSTAAEGFELAIDVNEWATTEAWDFVLEPKEPESTAGTSLEIVELNTGVGEEFGDEVFVNRLRAIIARDYSLILRDGFEIQVNTENVEAFQFGWLQSEDFQPVSLSYVDDNVTIDLVAGSSRIPPDDDDAEQRDTTDTQYFGWFVVCNDRVVLAGNKDALTVWGDEGFTAWHPQYNGFTGVIHFRAEDPHLLPWNTTKRGVDETSPIYRRAVAKMKEATLPYTKYTNARKQDLEEAKRRERAATLIPTPPARTEMKVPIFSTGPRIRNATISYIVPERDFLEAAKALGDSKMSRKEVGLRTFAFFRERMVEGE